MYNAGLPSNAGHLPDKKIWLKFKMAICFISSQSLVEDSAICKSRPSGCFLLRAKESRVKWFKLLWGPCRHCFISWLAIGHYKQTMIESLNGTKIWIQFVVCLIKVPKREHLFCNCQLSREIWQQVLSHCYVYRQIDDWNAEAKRNLQKKSFLWMLLRLASCSLSETWDCTSRRCSTASSVVQTIFFTVKFKLLKKKEVQIVACKPLHSNYYFVVGIGSGFVAFGNEMFHKTKK